MFDEVCIMKYDKFTIITEYGVSAGGHFERIRTYIYNLKGSNHNNFALIGILICQNLGLDTKNIFLCLLVQKLCDFIGKWRPFWILAILEHSRYYYFASCRFHTLRRFNKINVWWSLYHEIWQMYDYHIIWSFRWRPFWKWPGIPLLQWKFRRKHLLC